MSHHSREPFEEEMNESNFKKMFKQNEISPDLLRDGLQQLGATGNFPNGKLTEKDEGEIAIGIAVKDENIIMNFGKPTVWIGFTIKEAREIAEHLIRVSQEIELTQKNEKSRS